MRFGVAGLAESINEIDELRVFSQALLKESKFSGISQIEFKKNNRDGKFYLMEINPRIWLWMQTAVGSGVNLALAYYSHLAGLPEKKYQQSGKCMFINGLSMFDNTFRERKLTWLPYYIKSCFTRRIYSIKDKNDPKPYQIESRRFLKKIIH
jgi:predicted ATP-grasp superfamily ATP-dependent carboligase